MKYLLLLSIIPFAYYGMENPMQKKRPPQKRTAAGIKFFIQIYVFIGTGISLFLESLYCLLDDLDGLVDTEEA